MRCRPNESSQPAPPPVAFILWAMRASLLLLLLGLATLGNSAPTIGNCPVFPANNYWNTPVDNLPVHASSAAWVSSIGASARLHPDWGNVLADNYGIPFATVDGSQSQVPIAFDPNGYGDESDPGPMPIPPNAPIEGGSAGDGDRHVLVADTTNCMLYELYYAFPVGGGTSWRVYSSARFDLRSNALRPASRTSADAAGLAIFPGLVRWDEVAGGGARPGILFPPARLTTCGRHGTGRGAAPTPRARRWARDSVSRRRSTSRASTRARR